MTRYSKPIGWVVGILIWPLWVWAWLQDGIDPTIQRTQVELVGEAFGALFIISLGCIVAGWIVHRVIKSFDH